MLTTAAVLPHPPFAIKGLNASMDRAYAPLHDAYARVGELLRSRMVDSLLLLTCRGERYEHAFALAVHDPARTSLREYGSMGYEWTWRTDTRLIDAMQRAFRKADIPTTLTTNETLDLSSCVVLSALRPWAEQMRISTLTLPAQSVALNRPGALLRDVLDGNGGRTAVLALADFSHRLTATAPKGVHPDAAALDNRIRQAVIDQNLSALRAITLQERLDVGAEELSSIELLLYVLGDTRPHFQEWAYLYPHGIGHSVLVADL